MTPLDSAQLVTALHETFDPVEQKRHAAERFLAECDKRPSFCTELLRVVIMPQVDTNTRLAASIHLKQRIASSWRSTAEPISDEDKIFVRANVFDACRFCGSSLVRVQLEECLRLLINKDFPEKWPEILTQAIEGLGSMDHLRTHASLVVVRKIASKCETGGAQHETDHHQILMQKLLPLLVPLAKECLSSGLGNPDPSGMLKLICKSFWSWAKVMPLHKIMTEEDMTVWMTIMEGIASFPMSREGLPEVYEDWDQMQQFKVKKWSLKIVKYLFSRRGNPIVQDNDEEGWATQFHKTWGCHHLKVLITILHEMKTNNRPVSSRELDLIFKYISLAMLHSCSFKILKPHLPFIFIEVVVPTLAYDASDVERWQHDTQEFVRQQVESLHSFSDRRMGARIVVTDAVTYRGKDTFDILMGHCKLVLETYMQAPEGQKNGPAKVAALEIVSTLAPRLCAGLRSQAVQVESLLWQHVYPEFASQDPFLRLHACCVYKSFLNRLKDPDPDRLKSVFAALCKCMEDPEIPVRIQAGASLSVAVSVDELHSTILSVLPSLMERLLGLLQENDSDEIAQTLENVINRFSDHVAPYAEKLTEQLVIAYQRMLASEEDEGFAPVHALQSILTILKSCDATMIARLERYLLPLLELSLVPDGIDMIEEGLEILAYLTHSITPISPQLWRYLPKLYMCMCGGSVPSFPLEEVFEGGWAPDYIGHMVPAMCNYVIGGASEFVKGANEVGVQFPRMVINMVAKTFTINSASCGGELDEYAALDIMSTMFESCSTLKGSLDPLLPEAIALLWRLWVNGYPKGTPVSCDPNNLPLGSSQPPQPHKSLPVLVQGGIVRALAAMLFYNCEVFLETVAKLGILEPLFASWCSNLGLHTRLKSRKVLVLAFCSLLGVAARGGLPVKLQEGLPVVVTHLAAQTHFIVELREREKGAKEWDNERKSDSSWSSLAPSSVPEQDLGEDDDADPSRDRDYIRKLGRRLRDHEEDSDEEDDEDFDGEDEHAPTLEVLKDVDELKVLAATLRALPEDFQANVATWLGPTGHFALVKRLNEEGTA